MAGGMH